MSFAVAAKGSDSGKVMAQESSAPISTAGARSTWAPVFLSVTRLTAAATGTPNATSVPSQPPPAWLTNMMTMPIMAAAMASQVRVAIFVFSTAHASTVAKSGDSAFTIRVLAVEVKVSAIMKQVNMVAHIAPEMSPASPLART